MRKGFCTLIVLCIAGTAACVILWRMVLHREPSQEVIAVSTGETSAITAQVIFPYAVPDTDLIIRELAFYEGPFLEDGSNEEVIDVAALVVENCGETALSQVSIVVQTENDVLYFDGTWLLPSHICVLLERNKSVYRNEAVQHCSAVYKNAAQSDLRSESVHIYEDSIDKLRIENSSGYNLENLRIYYKTYLEQTDMYMGGITYEIEINSLEKGESCTISPPYYVKGYSRVIFVQ